MIKFNRSLIFRHSVCLSIILIASFISSSVSQMIIEPPIIVDPPPIPVDPVPEKPVIEDLNKGKCDGPSRILGHISTDKPIYKPNDMAFIEVYVFDPTTKGPAEVFSQSYDYRSQG